MKKLFSILLIMLLCLSLCSCKSPDAKIVEYMINSIGPVTLENEGAIIAAEEAYKALDEKDRADVENYDVLTAARADYQALLETVEITIDNWQDYFELETVTCWNKNDFGETTSASIYTFFCVKDEYADRILMDPSELILESCSYWSLASVDYDLESKIMGEIIYFEPASEGILIGERTHYNTYTLNNYECILPSELIGNIFQYIPESALCAWYTGYVPDELYDGVDNQKGYSFFNHTISRIQGSIIYVK